MFASTGFAFHGKNNVEFSLICLAIAKLTSIKQESSLHKFESSAFAFVCFEISTLLKLEISTPLKLEISSFRRVDISKQTNAKADESNL